MLPSSQNKPNLNDSGGQVDVTYTDFAKIFDTVPHHRLLLKLKAYNINTFGIIDN